MTVDDLVATSEIHARELPHGYFPELGPRFLAAYHRSFVESPHAVATVATLDGKVAGFLVGTIRTGAHYRDVVRRHGLRLGLYALGGLLRNPIAVAHLVRSRLRRYLRVVVRYARGGGPPRTRTRHRPDGGPVAVLTHVAVLPGARGHGLGAELVGRFVDEVRAADVGEIRLVTLVGEEGAAEFYERLGWQRMRRRWGAGGRQVVEFRCSV